MIVNSMTLQEIRLELLKDLPALVSRLIQYKKEFRRKALKANRFPYLATYEVKTGRRKNLFTIIFVAKKRSDAHEPFFSVYGIYDRPEGSYGAMIKIGETMLTIYPPHFFKRYRERIVKDDKLTSKQLISLYFCKCWLLCTVFPDSEDEEVYDHIEDMATEEANFIGVMEEGYCFGTAFGDINLVKTIISEEDIFDSQREYLHELREEYNKIKVEQGLD